MSSYHSYVSAIILAIIIQLITPPASASKLKKVRFITSDGTLLSAYIMRPNGRGPFPAIIALHGCSGLKYKNRHKLYARHRDWGKRFVKWGYVVLFPDSHGSREVGSLCKKRNRPVTQTDRINDALSARRWLARQPNILRNHISLLGWSNGGATTLRIAYSKSGKVFRQAFALYPRCRFILKRNKMKQNIPLTIFMGKKDDWNDPKACQKLVWKRGGHIILYDKAYHGFDLPNEKLRTIIWLPYTTHNLGVAHLGTNKIARRQVIQDIKRLLNLRDR